MTTLPKFKLGTLIMTRGVASWSDPANDDGALISKVFHALSRHTDGDWGEMDPEDAALNDLSLEHNFGRLFSAYTIDGTKIWIITEADHSSTTILFPDEY